MSLEKLLEAEPTKDPTNFFANREFILTGKDFQPVSDLRGKKPKTVTALIDFLHSAYEQPPIEAVSFLWDITPRNPKTALFEVVTSIDETPSVIERDAIRNINKAHAELEEKLAAGHFPSALSFVNKKGTNIEELKPHLQQRWLSTKGVEFNLLFIFDHNQ